VERLLDDANEQTRVPVIIRFIKEYDISKLKEKYQTSHQYHSTSERLAIKRKQFRTEVFNSLKQQTQHALATVAGLMHKHGIKTQLKSLWTINGIALDAPTKLIDDIAKLPGVARITADMRLSMSAPQAEESFSEPQWNINRLNTKRLWQQGIAGEGVVVGIMDSGVDINHPDLSNRWRGGDNSWFDPYGEHTLPTDMVGHGTQALGLILGGDESGYQVGMAPEAKWIAAKIFDDANQTTLSAIHQAFQWLLDPDGDPLTDDAPHLVNNSWGFANTINQCYQEFDDDIRLLQEAGIGVVFSAGNYGPFTETSISPANNPLALSVGSIDQLDEIELLSSHGPGACDGGIYPKLVAPGALVFTTDLLPIAYNVVSGTSFAAPHITGAMALLMSAFPDLPVTQIETALYDSAADLGEPGTDDQFGYGLADVSAAYDLLFSSFGSTEQSLLLFNEPLYSVDEDTQYLIATVRRIGGSAGEVSVDYAARDDSASSGADYLQRSGRLSFADGETLRSFEIPIIDDQQDEENEAFILFLSNVRGNASLGHQNDAEVVILDNDGAGSIAFSSHSIAVNEARGEALITLVRTGGASGSTEVAYHVIADTATTESDFVTTEGKIRFLPGETEKQILVELIDDTLFEGNERFHLLLSNPDGKAEIGEPASTTVTILDDDPDSRFASISLETVSFITKENSTQVDIDVIRRGNLDISASVAYNTLDGSAKQDEDYVSANGIITFPKGTSRRRIQIDILNDTLYEKESSFTLSLFEASEGAVISKPWSAIIRIIDDDALPFVSLHSSPSSSAGSISDFALRKRLGEAKREGQTRSSSLQVFELSLSGFGPSGQQGIEALQELSHIKNDTKKNEKEASGTASCGSETTQDNCVSEQNEQDRQPDQQTEERVSKITGSNINSQQTTEQPESLNQNTTTEPIPPSY
jgi:subtilisin family serine protease